MDTPKTPIPIELPRGIRDNNPGNIRSNPNIMWKGQVGVDEGGYLKFKSAVWGIRAMAMILRHYHEYTHCNSLQSYVTRWAPPTENASWAYVQDVAARMGVYPAVPVDLHTQGIALVTAIIWHENGQCPYDSNTIAGAVHLSHIQ